MWLLQLASRQTYLIGMSDYFSVLPVDYLVNKIILKFVKWNFPFWTIFKPYDCAKTPLESVRNLPDWLTITVSNSHRWTIRSRSDENAVLGSTGCLRPTRWLGRRRRSPPGLGFSTARTGLWCLGLTAH